MAEVEIFVQLSEVLLSADTLPSHLELFLPDDRQWSGGTVGALLDPDDDEDPENSIFAKKHRLIPALGVPEIQDVVSNARQQDPDANKETLLQAFLYYFQNDAFIEFSSARSY